MNPSNPDRSGEFPPIGREKELSMLQACYVVASQGGGAMAMVEGEAGVGKTHLLRAFMAWAERQGARVLHATCREIEADLPYSVMVRMFRALLPRSDARPEASIIATLQVQPWLPVLLHLLPELAQWLEVGPIDEHSANLPPKRASNFTPGQVHEGVAQVIGAMARRAPLIAVFEDLHWADTATLELLAAIFRRLRSSSVMIVGSYRPEEVDESHPLHQLNTRLSRVGGVLRVRLHPLEPAAIQQLLEASVPAAIIEDVQGWGQHVEGIPAFWVAWARLAAGGEALDAMPRNLRGINELMLTRLEADARHVLEAMAVLDTDVSADLLAAVTELPRDRAVAILRRLIGDGVVAAEAGKYAIADMPLARAAYEILDEEQRQHLHLRAGQALDPGLFALPEIDDHRRASAESVAAMLAFHYNAAGQSAMALRYMMMAGAWAYRLFALDEARKLYWSALSQATLVGEAQAQTTIYTALGKIHADLGRHRTALEHFYAALGGAGAESQPEGYRQQALIRVHIARSLDALSEHEQAREFLQQALRTVADKHDPGVSCVIRLYLAWIEEHLGNRETALAMASQALGAAQSAKDPSLEADVTLLLALLNWRQGDLNRAQALCRYGLQIREEVKDAAGCARAWHCLGMIEHDRGQFQMARDCFATSARIYRQIGEGVLEAMVRVHWGDTCVAANDLAASVEQFRQAVALYQEFQGVERNPDLSLWTHPDLE